METQAPFRHSSDVLSYTPGQAIFRRGERGEHMYVVLEGEVDLVAGYSVLETAGPGALVGEMSLVDRRPRNASAIARTPCKLVPVDAKRFSLLLLHDPGDPRLRAPRHAHHGRPAARDGSEDGGLKGGSRVGPTPARTAGRTRP